MFLSHNLADKPRVRRLAERLQAAGLRIWFDEWIIQPGGSPRPSDGRGVRGEGGEDRGSAGALQIRISDFGFAQPGMSSNVFGSDWAQLEAGTCGRRNCGSRNLRFRDPLNQERRFIPLRLDEELRAVLTLLAGAGVVWELAFGSCVLLQPERIDAYAQAVIRTLPADERQRGCLMEERVMQGDVTYESSTPLNHEIRETHERNMEENRRQRSERVGSPPGHRLGTPAHQPETAVHLSFRVFRGSLVLKSSRSWTSATPATGWHRRSRCCW